LGPGYEVFPDAFPGEQAGNPKDDIHGGIRELQNDERGVVIRLDLQGGAHSPMTDP
jgi:hypothetical protein